MTDKQRAVNYSINKGHMVSHETKRECSGISGVLIRLTACKRLTNSLPKLSYITLSGVLVRSTTLKKLTHSLPKPSLITLSLPETAWIIDRSARNTGGPVNPADLVSHRFRGGECYTA